MFIAGLFTIAKRHGINLKPSVTEVAQNNTYNTMEYHAAAKK
jgi:hypothetical protein